MVLQIKKFHFYCKKIVQYATNQKGCAMLKVKTS